MSDTESIFKQSIRATALRHRIEENERLRQQMVDDIVYKKSFENLFAKVNEYTSIVIDGKIRFIKVLVNDPATILFIEGKKYVCKCHDEEFNPTKGILVCIAKHLGVTHSRIKEILKRRGLANSQDAELCLLWDIADSGGFDEIAVAEMVEKAKIYVNIRSDDDTGR